MRLTNMKNMIVNMMHFQIYLLRVVRIQRNMNKLFPKLDIHLMKAW